MRLKELSRAGGAVARYVAPLADVAGARQFEITISGPRRLVEKAFSDVDFEVRIDSTVKAGQVDAMTAEVWDRYARRHQQVAPVATVDDLRKKLPTSPNPEKSVVLSLRRVEGKGTFWSAYFPTLGIPMGVSLFFVLPPVCSCFGAVFPSAGDADLFLSLGSPFILPVSAGTKGGLAIDTVAFGSPLCWPWAQVTPWYRVLGFLPSVTDLLIGGFSSFP